MKKHRMVYVEWEDSAGSTRWMDLERATQFKTSQCETLGYLIKSDRQHIVVASCRCPDTDEVSHLDAIPRSCIRSMWSVEVKDGHKDSSD